AEDANQTLMDKQTVRWRERMVHLPCKASAVAGRRSKRLRSLEIVRSRGRSRVSEVVETETYGSHTFRVSGYGFWQVHRDAPETLVNAVMDALDVQPGQVIADLYGGAGLFSRFIADGVEEDGAVLSVEASPGASRDARKNLYDKKQAYVI